MPLFTSEYVFSDDYPTIEPSLKLDFANARALDPRITFTRASTATYVGRDGLIKTAGVNEPRFEHDPETLECLGLLIEEERTNEILNSQVFTSGWNRSGIDTITQNTTVTTPEGLTDGVGVITESSGGTVHQFYEASSAQITGIRTYSIFVKPNGRNYCVLMTSSFTHDLVNGTTLGSASGEYVSATTTKFANGWVRCTVTVNHSNSFDQFNFKLAKDGLNDISYSGDGTSGVYVWGAQLEGAFPTSYIPTSGATASRAHERAQILGDSLTSFLRQGEGSVICSGVVNALTTSSNYQSWWTLDQNNASFRIWLYARGGANKNQFIGGDGSTSFAISSSSDTVVDQKYKLACAYKENDVAFYENGTQVGTDTNGDIPTVTHFGIGSRNDAQLALNGTISNLSYYSKRLPNAQLQTLTQ